MLKAFLVAFWYTCLINKASENDGRKVLQQFAIKMPISIHNIYITYMFVHWNIACTLANFIGGCSKLNGIVICVQFSILPWSTSFWLPLFKLNMYLLMFNPVVCGIFLIATTPWIKVESREAFRFIEPNSILCWWINAHNAVSAMQQNHWSHGMR